ncbi:carboxypeptidase-like regulatory domain-containing protein [Flavobacterium sp.]|uniref:TonB-dependent receptor n=1 Tax=Flavobacterium sp. TaxID=239 RepID=UPI003527C39E
MLKKGLFTFFIYGITFCAFAQEKFTLSGTITDALTGETMIGVTILIPDLNTGTTTNEYGFYSITLPKADYRVVISFIGFESIEETITLAQNIRKNYSLKESSQLLNELVIENNLNKIDIKKPEMSVNRLSAAAIKKMPVLLGEVDVVKSLLFLPGVTNAGEGQSGFNVRGGAVDQNLVLLDEATLYNTSHVFGLFSVFNADAIKDLKLYKGGIPAQYGGRVSSVLDIYQKEGNSTKFSMNGGIGLISSRLLLEGPIVKNKSSFLVAGRGSYAHLFLKLTDNPNSAYFYDLNTKLNYKFNDNNSLYLSGYFGRDVFTLNKLFSNTYGNSTLNIRWNHIFSNKLFANTSFIFSDYYYGLTLDFVGFDWVSSIKNYNFKYDLNHYVSDKTQLNYGALITKYDLNPGIIDPITKDAPVNYRELEKKHAFELGIYTDIKQKVTEKFSASLGLRFSYFNRVGKSTINYYANNEAVVFNEAFQIYEKGTVTATKYFNRNKSIATYNNFEPRASVSYELTKNSAIKANYNRMAQYMQLISNTASPTPLDVWTPSDNYIKPQLADQYAIGYFRNIKDGDYTLEIESFYKKVKNRIDYIDGADLIANDAIEQVILNGKMRSYGLELLFKKNIGKLRGWVAYTLSRSEQKTPARTAVETGINNGNWYLSAYDKTHNLAITSTYEFSNKWQFAANFTLQSGQPVTFPNGKYVFQGVTVPNYGLRNQNRLPAYHRLDLSATLIPQNQQNKKYTHEWVFGIYNVYSRNNAASIRFRENAETGVNEAVRLSIFGIVPSVSFNFKF